MHFRSATKVGLAVVSSVVVFVAIWFFLVGKGFGSNTYPLQVRFPDAQNITPGAEVRMAGVEVGLVKGIALAPDNQAVLNLAIYKQNKIPQGSRFVITAGGLIGEKYVSIMPRIGAAASIPERAKIQGETTVQIEDLMAKASQLATSADQVIRESQLALRDTRAAIQGMSRYIQDPRLKNSLLTSLQNAEAASRNAEAASQNIVNATQTADRTAGDLRSLMAESKTGVRDTLASFNRTADNVENLTGALNDIVSGTDIKSGLGGTVNNLRVASEQLPVIATRMSNIAANLENLSGDPTLTADLKTTVANLRAASAEARESSVAINQSVQRLTARFRRPRTPGASPNGANSTPPAVQPHSTIDLAQNLDPSHFHADVNTFYPFGTNSFLAAGLYGLGEENRLNLQMGQALSEGWTTRYGLYKGKIGLGLDRNLGQENGWSANLYHPNEPSLDLLIRRRLKEDTSLTFGVERVFQNPTPTVGVRIRR